MLEAGAGSIINMSSAASSVITAPNRFVYGATKAGVIGMSFATDCKPGHPLQRHLSRQGEKAVLEQRMCAQGGYEKTRAAFIARQLIGRIGTAE